MNEKYMYKALKQAKKGYKKKQIPVGAVIVEKNKIISKAYNKRHKTNKIIAHAEIIAILKANKKKKNWRLNNCDLYVTLEPCDMCKEVIKEARIRNVYFSLRANEKQKNINYKQIKKYKEETHELLKSFFKTKRK